MVITRATEYSIRAVLHLAARYPGDVVSKQEICRDEDITPAFLVKIMQPLVRSGLVRSKRGVAGGFALARDPADVTILDVMHAVDEPITLNLCLLEPGACDRDRMCPVHDLWVDARRELEEIFSRDSLADLVEKRRARESERGPPGT